MTQVILLKSNAALCCSSICCAQVHENSTAFARYRRRVVVAQHHDQVIEMIVTPELLMAVRAGQLYRPVIVARGGIITPARTRMYEFNR